MLNGEIVGAISDRMAVLLLVVFLVLSYGVRRLSPHG